MAKAKGPGRKPPETTVDHVLNWFRGSPERREMERQARDAERAYKDRVAAFERWQAAEERKAEIPALRAAREAAEAEYRDVVRRAGRKVSEARTAEQDLVQSIQHEQSRAEKVLRSTNPVAKEASDVFWTLSEARRHLQTHIPINLATLRENLRDAEKNPGVPAAGTLPREGVSESDVLRPVVEQADAASEALPLFDAALDRLRSVELELEPDLPALVSEVTAELPDHCPACDARLNAREKALAKIANAPSKRWEGV